VGEASGSEPAARPQVLGVPLDLIARAEALNRLHVRSTRTGPGLWHVVTLNPEYVMAAGRDSAFRAAIARAELILCDGAGTLAAAKLIHGNRAGRLQRLTGAELVTILAAWSALESDGGLFLLGGRSAEDAALALRRRYPACRIAGAWSGGQPGEDWDAESLERIGKSGPTVLMVAYGAPDQVLWIERNRAALERAGVRLAVGIGGALDYLSGHAKPVPELARRLGLEWLARLVREPWRWRRQLALPRFAALTLIEAARARAGRLPEETGRA
jgi:N-acetylglucosaminyldiphosphoundecaprenol N-acetyl-beta-D-mannosaminyltransferase